MAPVTVPLTPLAAFIRYLRENNYSDCTERLISLLQRREIQRPRLCAHATTRLLQRVLSDIEFTDAHQLIRKLKELGRRLQSAQPREFAIGNVVRRCLGLVREVAEGGPDQDASLQPSVPGSFASLPRVLPNGSGTDSRSLGTPIGTPLVTPLITPMPTPFHEEHKAELRKPEDLSADAIREDVLNGLGEMLDELEQADEQIASYAAEHISANDVVLTYTPSLTIQKFLIHAAKRRKFTVIVAEGYPNEREATYETVLKGRRRGDTAEEDQGNRLRTLTSYGVTVIVVPDAAVYALMPKVDKIVLSALAVFSNGGVVAAAGSAMICAAAKEHSASVAVLSPVYKLSPTFPYDEQDVVEEGNPMKLANSKDDDFPDDINVFNPLSDYIGPEYISAVITNVGAQAPSYMYRVAADHYREEDVELE